MDKKILLTTPSCEPERGGLSTFTTNIETVLIRMKVDYDLFYWQSVNDLRNAKIALDQYFAMINIHFMGGYFLDDSASEIRKINFIHGSEILFYSPCFYKRLAKHWLKPKMLTYFGNSYLNLFISQFTMEKLHQQGLKADYGRDVIVHNSIPIIPNIEFIKKSLDQEKLSFVCIARDVPHKNLAGCVEFCELLAEASGKNITLSLTTKQKIVSDKININYYDDLSDCHREELYKSAHFNLLLSLDHSHIGFFEGFGLTVLEAGKYGVPSIVMSTGGLPESVHDKYSGRVITKIDRNTVVKIWSELNHQNHYQQISHNCFQHTLSAHSLNIYQKILTEILL